MCGCSCDQVDEDVQKEKDLETLLEKWRDAKGSLIPTLQGAQEIYGYLPKEILLKIAVAVKVTGQPGFWSDDFLCPVPSESQGRNITRVCLGTACHVRGGRQIFERMKQELGIDDGETTPDMRYTLETVACLGCCGLSPVIMINGEAHGRLTPDGLKEIVDKYQ